MGNRTLMRKNDRVDFVEQEHDGTRTFPATHTHRILIVDKHSSLFWLLPVNVASKERSMMSVGSWGLFWVSSIDSIKSVVELTKRTPEGYSVSVFPVPFLTKGDRKYVKTCTVLCEWFKMCATFPTTLQFKPKKNREIRTNSRHKNSENVDNYDGESKTYFLYYETVHFCDIDLLNIYEGQEVALHYGSAYECQKMRWYMYLSPISPNFYSGRSLLTLCLLTV